MRRAGRRRPYTTIGIRRLACTRCGGRPSYSTWQVCADDSLHRPLCWDCDLLLNALVLRWMGDPDAERKVDDYALTGRR